MPASKTATLSTSLLLVPVLTGGAPAAQEAGAPPAKDELIFGAVLGDLRHATTANPGRVHVAGNLGAASADYFRGKYDGVPSDLDEIAIGPDLGVAFELFEDQPWPVSDLSLTVGTQNNLADQAQPTDSSVEDWYESNNFVALTAGLGED